jgi:hypothetical protein
MRRKRVFVNVLFRGSSRVLSPVAGRGLLVPLALCVFLVSPVSVCAGDDVLPLTEATLFASGVGYFERAGVVYGDRIVTLRFPARDIDDLLKSLIVRDLGGGRVGEIRYGARDPLSRALESFSLDLRGDPSFPELVKQARGEEVRLAGHRELTGTVLGVEERTVSEGVTAPFLVLSSEAGIQSIPFSGIETLIFTDTRLQRELEQALSLIAENRNTETRPVSIEFAGTGEREVRAAYIVETPVWKTSYRVVLGEGDEHHIQGWAIIENTGEEDWENVTLSLVTGRPISFFMEISRPVYIQRPRIGVETGPRVEPQVYRDAVPLAERDAPKAASESRMFESAEARSGILDSGEGDLFAGLEQTAQTMDAGEFFVYRAEHPVSIPRRSSALVPIFGRTINGERISIYDSGVHAERPLNGILLENTTGLHLTGGPVTVFEDGVYAGDSLFDDIRPDDERLLSFSVDLDTRVITDERDEPEDITRVRISRGVLVTTRLQRKTRTYTVTSDSPRAKTILILHPRSSGWTLARSGTADAKNTTTADAYRFRIELSPESPRAELAVTEERAIDQTVSLRSVGSDTVQFYLRERTVSEAVKRALQQVQELSREAREATRQREQIETSIREIHREQERIRANMAGLDRDSALYRRYVQSLNAQEDQLSALQSDLTAARRREDNRKNALEEYIQNMDAE